MSFGGSKKKEEKAPAQQPFQNYTLSRDGNQYVSSILDKGTNTLNTSITSTPEENQMREYFSSLFGNIGPQLMQTPEQRTKQVDDFKNSLFQEFKQPLDDNRASALLRTKENFNARGLSDSTSLEDYKRKNIEEVYQRGLQDATRQSIFGAEDLASNDESRLMRLLQMASGGMQGDLSTMFNANQSSLGGLNSVNSIMNQRYANELSRVGMNAQLRAMQAGGGGGGGFSIGGLGFGF